MKSKLFWTLAVMVLTGLGWAAVPVQAAEEEQRPAFSAVDKDKSGDISIDEAAAVPSLVESLPQLDKNVDGKISKEEYAAMKSVTPGAGGESGATPGTKMEE